jgi:hypothetical protein
MSNERHASAHLAGHDGPYFVLTDELRTAFDTLEDRTGSTLGQLGRLIAGFARLEQEPKTNDDYVWFWSPRFRTPYGEMVILIPWSTDPENRDGTRADRSCAIYTTGLVSEFMMRVIMRQFIRAITDRQARERMAMQARVRKAKGIAPV